MGVVATLRAGGGNFKEPQIKLQAITPELAMCLVACRHLLLLSRKKKARAFHGKGTNPCYLAAAYFTFKQGGKGTGPSCSVA